MSLPFQFAAVTDATGAQIDANNAALGALTPIPCTASGSNSQVLTANASTPTITAYSNYRQFSFIAAQSNTGAATGKVGTLATLPINKNSPAGPIALTGGEIVAGVAYILLYDSALNSGGGGFHLLGAAAITAGGGSVNGPIVGTGTLATITYPVAVFTTLSASLASLTRLSIGAGPNITRQLRTLASLSFSALNPQTGSTSDILFSGVSVNDVISLGFPSGITVGMIYKGFVPNAGTVTLQVFNASSGTVTPISGSYAIQAVGYS